MAERLSKSQVILLAINLTIETNSTKQLRSLISQYSSILHTSLVLRILLTYLPETVNVAEYLPLLQELVSGNTPTTVDTVYVDTTSVKDLDEKDVLDEIRGLHLEPLIWPDAPIDVPEEPVVQFLIHRAYKIDQETGFIAQLPDLTVPFLDRFPYLRSWLISTLLPILRTKYEYYPQVELHETIATFAKLDMRRGVAFLLSQYGKNFEVQQQNGGHVARDLRGLVGPWMYGASKQKRRKLGDLVAQEVDVPQSLNAAPNLEVSDWQYVFVWILEQASTSWEVCVEAINDWEGPADIDLGGYDENTGHLAEQEQRTLELQYARTALAAAYSIQAASSDALDGIHKILSRTSTLLDLDPLPSLEADIASLPTIHTDEINFQLAEHAKYITNDLLNDENVLTTPGQQSLDFLHGVLLSTRILTRFGISCNMRNVGQLALLQNQSDQCTIFDSLQSKMVVGPRGDDQYWSRCRTELLWLHSWGSAEISDGEGVYGGGILGRVAKSTIETELLKMFLANTRYSLARLTYEDSNDHPLSKQQLQNAIVASALQAYDGSSNANRTRGGVKKCVEIMSALPQTMRDSEVTNRVRALIEVTHALGKYKLVLKQGEPFLPIDIRLHKDPVVLLEKILQQNPGTYTQMQEFVDMAEAMVEAGLLSNRDDAYAVRDSDLNARQKALVAKRVQALCIDAALAEDDFETAYSYTMTKLEDSEKTQVATDPASGSKIPIDDFAWRAALQAGKYRMNSRTTKPTHVGNSSGNLEVRHLEQRLECISLALRIAPQSTLQEILNVARRCEEELEVKLKEDAEAESAWDLQAEQTTMPGGFGTEPKPTSLSRHGIDRAAVADGPVSIFDLTKASAAKAQKTLSVMSGLKLGSERSQQLNQPPSSDEPVRTSGEYVGGVFKPGARKRDQIREAAVGTLASGVGWLIGASSSPRPQSPTTSER